jgi:hypothetical protein
MRTNIASLFKGSNFMTPDILRYGRSDEHGKGAAGRVRFYELSTGRGFKGEPIFGVTVRDSDGNRFDPDLSKMFFSRRAAEDYIEEL